MTRLFSLIFNWLASRAFQSTDSLPMQPDQEDGPSDMIITPYEMYRQDKS